MPKGYWIPHLDVSNPEGFDAYRQMADVGHKKFGSKLLVRGGRREVMEGKMRSRNVLREFYSFEEALAYYRGPEYSAAHELRVPHAECDLLIAEGFDGPQPEQIGALPAAGALKGYWIAHMDVTDPEGYEVYRAAITTTLGKFGARFLVSGGRSEVVEGHARSRCIVIEFPSYEAALACYRAPDYQTAKALRAQNDKFDLLVIEGYGGNN